MNGITTHVLDISRGRPASGLRIELHRMEGASWRLLGAGITDQNGRCNTLMDELTLQKGTYRLQFNAAAYFQDHQAETFYSEIPIVFEVLNPDAHYHVPLLISPFGYSTYRGS